MIPVRLCHIDDLADCSSRGFYLDGLKLFAVRIRDRIYLYHNRCPHLGVALEWVEHQFLDSSKTLIQCANHGALFLPSSGQCVSGPCVGQSLVPYPFELMDGTIFIHLESTGGTP